MGEFLVTSSIIEKRNREICCGSSRRYNTFKGTMNRASRLDITEDIQPLTTFRNNSVAFLQQLKKTKRPVVLTVNGKAVAVVQDAEAYRRLLDIAAQADGEEGIRQGREDVAKGRVSPVRKALKSFRREHPISS